eukprot:gene20029-biopygen20569
MHGVEHAHRTKDRTIVDAHCFVFKTGTHRTHRFLPSTIARRLVGPAAAPSGPAEVPGSEVLSSWCGRGGGLPAVGIAGAAGCHRPLPGRKGTARVRSASAVV